jgi:AraC-like DNA-binding protein/mannose-6-phosphate isomerase-like protein (cupin superfamily)
MKPDHTMTEPPAPTTMVRNAGLPFMEIKEGTWKGYSVRTHSHEELTLGFVEKGGSTITCNALEFKIKEGQSILIPPGMIHLCRPDDLNRYRFTMLYMDPRWFETAFKIEPAKIRPRIRPMDPPALEEKERFLASFKTGDDPLDLESRAILFLGNFMSGGFGMKGLTPPLTGGRAELEAVRQYMDQNFSDQIQLDDLARISGMTKFSLLRRFKARYQLSPHAYLINKRIHLARQLLLEGNTVASTAVTCGFFDQSHFVKTFRQYVGISPMDYK